jgi:hypothetical protein
MKIDAQGHDLSVLAGAGAELLRGVDEVSMETLHDECDGIYDEQPNCSATVLRMATLGFRPSGRFRCDQSRHFTQGSGCEANVLFRNVAAPPLDAGGAGSGRNLLKGKRRGRGRATRS